MSPPCDCDDAGEEVRITASATGPREEKGALATSFEAKSGPV